MIIGLTGGIGTGKSTASNFFKEFGCHIISADDVYSRLIKKNSPLYRRIVKAFGKQILDKNKNIDRRILGAIVFNNKKKLKQLNTITHPEIIKEIIAKIKKNKVNIVEAPLLFEANMENMFDNIIVIKCKKDIQVRRLIKKTGLTREEILQRINSQMPLGKKVKMADYVVDGGKSIPDMKEEVYSVWQRIQNE